MTDLINDYLEYLTFKDLYQQTLNEITFLTEDSIKKQETLFKSMVKQSEKALKKFKVNLTIVKKFSNRINKTLKTSYERGISSENASKKIVADFVKEMKTELTKLSIPGKIYASIVAFIIILVLNSVMLAIGGNMLAIFGLSMTNSIALLIPIVGPLFEEAIKNIFIQAKMPWLGTGVVFGGEMLLYLYKFWKNGKLALQIVIGRLVSLIFHFFTTAVQKGYMEKNPDKAFTAYMIGFFVHFAWNSMAAIAIISRGATLADAGLS